ncbi:hypothetical protein NDU88_004178 [Pleurodeles waltl]|uniref:Secreted protein n=1 Tax=Pleurodeles waltl TaxID=8319 RepID=A0AAV7WR43_PLEWA|nr:hypothetical protein NDU88_004178 [Pleurodeles waltl]
MSHYHLAVLQVLHFLARKHCDDGAEASWASGGASQQIMVCPWLCLAPQTHQGNLALVKQQACIVMLLMQFVQLINICVFFSDRAAIMRSLFRCLFDTSVR